MNDVAPEASAEPVTPASCGEQMVTRHGAEPDALVKATTICPCHATAAEHEAFVDAYARSVRDGSRYAGLPEYDDEELS